MEPTQELIDSIYTEKVVRARGTPVSEKLVAGLRLLAMAREAARAGIRAQHPEASELQVEELLRRRIALGEMLGSREGE